MLMMQKIILNKTKLLISVSVTLSLLGCSNVPREQKPKLSAPTITLPVLSQPSQQPSFLERIQSFLSGKLPEQME
jgi:hypothetical protein